MANNQQQVSVVAVLVDRLSPGLSKIRNQLTGLNPAVSRLGSGFSTLGGQVTGLLGAFAGLAGIEKSIHLAEEHEKAEVRLLAALGGRRRALEEILEVTKELKALAPTLSDLQLKDSATLLLNLGVASDKLRDSLQAAANTSVALGVDLETATREIAQIQDGKLGRLGGKIPALRQLAEDGRLAAEGVATLNRVFRDQAAALGATTFGKIEQALDRVEEHARAVGKAFGELKATFLSQFADELEGLAEFVHGDTFTVIIDVVRELVPALTKAVGLIAGFIAFRTVGGILVNSVLRPIGSIASGLFSILGIVGRLVVAMGPLGIILVPFVAGVLKAVGAFDSLKSAIGSVGELFEKLKSGDVTVEELFVRARFGAERLAVTVDELLIGPVTSFLDATIGKIEKIGEKVGGVLKRFDLLRDAETESEKRTREIEETAQGIIDQARTFGGPVPTIEDARKQAAQTLGFLDGVKTTQSEAISATERLKQRLSEISEQEKRALDDIRAKRQEASEAEDRRLDTALEAFRSQIDSTQDELDRITASERIIRLTAHVEEIDPAEIRKLTARLDSDLAEPTRKVLEEALKQGVQSGAISAQRAADILAESEIPALQQKQQILDGNIGRVNQELRALDGIVREQFEELNHIELVATSLEEGRAKREEILETTGKQAELTRDLVRLERERALAGADLAAAEQRVTGVRIAAAGKIVEDARKARGDLDDQIQDIGELQKTGAIGGFDAIERQNAAIGAFKAKVAESNVELERMRAEFPQISAAIDDAEKELADLTRGLHQVDQDDFFGGLRDGFRSVSQDLDSLRDLGAQVGQDLATSLSEGLVDVFLRGRRTFREWLTDVLEGVAALAAKFLILKGLGQIPGVGEFLGLPGAGGTKPTGEGGTAEQVAAAAAQAGGAGGQQAVGTMTVVAQVVNILGATGGGGGGVLPNIITTPGGGTQAAGVPGGGTSPDTGGTSTLAMLRGLAGPSGGNVNPSQEGGGGFLSSLMNLGGGILSPFTGLFSGLTGGGGGALTELLNSGSGGLAGILEAFGNQGVGGTFSALGSLISGGLGGLGGGLGGLAGLLTSGGTGGLAGLGTALTGGFQTGASQGLSGLLSALTGGFSAGTGAATTSAVAGALPAAADVAAGTAGSAVPFLGPILQLLMGNTEGALVSGGLTAAGIALAAPTGGLSLLLPLLGSFFSFEEGGLVPGNPAAGDSVPIMAMGREFVQPTHAVDFYGESIMDAIRSHRVPRDVLDEFAGGARAAVAFRGGYADGGSVSRVGRSRSRGSMPPRALIVSNDQQMDRLLAGSPRTVARFMGDNRHEMRTALGIEDKQK